MAHPNLSLYWQGTLTTLWWISYPFAIILYYVAIVLLFIGKLLYGPVATFLSPFIYVGRFVVFMVTLPYHLLAKFEPLYNFLGVAAIIGVLIGLGLYYSSQQFDALPDINEHLTPYLTWTEGRSIKQYRDRKGKSRAAIYSSVPSSGYASLSDSIPLAGRGRRNLLAQTILEEDDSDY